METDNLSQREPLLWLAIIVGGWGSATLITCWWQGLIGITVAALIVRVRYQMKLKS